MSNLRPILSAWLGLLTLLALTIGASFLPLGSVLPVVSYGIATAKAMIVVWIFMEMKSRDGLQRLSLAAGFVWLAFLLILVLVDALTRGWVAG
jgi:cytochrome c oxidase subunit 4